MCANKGGPLKPDHVNVQLSVVPSSLSLARKVPLAPLVFGGTSLNVDSRVEKRRHSHHCCCSLASRDCRSIVQLWPPARRSNIIFSSLAPFKAPRKRRTPRDRDVAFWSVEGLFFVTIYQRGVAIVNKLLIVVSGRRNFLQRQIEKCQARTLHSGLD